MNFVDSLHLQALEAAKRFKQAEADLLDLFQKIEEARIFLKLGHTSLFDYGVKALGLSEANTYAFIQVARKAREVPELKAAIQEGSLTLSKAKRIVPVITSANSRIWLQAAQVLSKNDIEKEVARINPKAAIRESSRYVAENRIELKVGISEGLMIKLRRIQDLESQRTQKAASLEDALEKLAELYLEKNDPVRKAWRTRPQLGPGPVNRPGRSRIPSLMRHALNLRDDGRCTYIDEFGNRCTRKRWIEIHHIKPVSEGGENTISNLTTLCFHHHRFAHRGTG